MIGRLDAARAVALHPAVSVKAKPSSCSPKYSTMSLRSNSPWTSTSRPSSSWQRTHAAVSLAQEASYSGALVALPPIGGARRRGLRRSAGRSRWWWWERRAALNSPVARGFPGGNGSSVKISRRHRCEYARRTAPRGSARERRRELARRGWHELGWVAVAVQQRARASVPTPPSFSSAKASQIFSSGSSCVPSARSIGTCCSEHAGATHSRSAPSADCRFAQDSEGASRSVVQTLRPSTTPSERI